MNRYCKFRFRTDDGVSYDYDGPISDAASMFLELLIIAYDEQVKRGRLSKGQAVCQVEKALQEEFG